jgi:acetate kinase
MCWLLQVLVLNCGSSTVKYKLFNMKEDRVLAGGLAERIGSPGSRILHRAGEQGEYQLSRDLPGHHEAVQAVLDLLTGAEYGVVKDVGEIRAVGHRVVHGGSFFSKPVLVDQEVLGKLEACSRLAPLHNPPNIVGIQACRKMMPGAAQVAVLDTAFHQTLPEYAFMYGVPYDMYRKHQIRKYGFHGISHSYVAGVAAEMLGAGLEDLKIITCHLGNGASLCAVGGGRSVDTTMGFTPLAGLIMGTRCGDIDPAVIQYMAEKEHIDLGGVMEVLNKKSGVLGISGISADFRDVERAAAGGHQRSALALEMFSYSAARAIGSLVPALGGLDALVFTAGIGENAPDIRRRICARLQYLGVELDEKRNAVAGRKVDISAPGTPVRVLVVATDEERMIARETRALVEGL